MQQIRSHEELVGVLDTPLPRKSTKSVTSSAEGHRAGLRLVDRHRALVDKDKKAGEGHKVLVQRAMSTKAPPTTKPTSNAPPITKPTINRAPPPPKPLIVFPQDPRSVPPKPVAAVPPIPVALVKSILNNIQTSLTYPPIKSASRAAPLQHLAPKTVPARRSTAPLSSLPINTSRKPFPALKPPPPPPAYTHNPYNQQNQHNRQVRGPPPQAWAPPPWVTANVESRYHLQPPVFRAHPPGYTPYYRH